MYILLLTVFKGQNHLKLVNKYKQTYVKEVPEKYKFIFTLFPENQEKVQIQTRTLEIVLLFW